MIYSRIAALLVCGTLWGCATAQVSLAPTLLSGMQRYDGEMQSIGVSGSRWPERQRAAGELKTVITGTVGGSREFYRLVDLDIRRREYLIAMRETTSLRADRLQEMKDELAQMSEETNRLKPIVRAQMAALPAPQDAQLVERIAAQGLLSMALDSFSNDGERASDTPSTKIDGYAVTDQGTFSTVRSPEGQSYRCSLFGTGEEGVGIRCEPVK